MIFSAVVVNGKPLLKPEETKMLNSWLRGKNGKTVWMMFDDRRPPRTMLQNNYLWLLYDYVSDHTGSTSEEVHAEMRQYLPRFYTKDAEGNEIEVEKSTTRLTTKEFNKYIAELKAWAAREHGITLPEPIQAERLNATMPL